jgi:hypothetical protein
MRVHPAAALAALVVVAVVAVVAMRQRSIGETELAAAGEAAGRSDWPEAIARARAAAEALVPGSPWPERARALLESIGRNAEARGDDENALLAYGALRTAAIATRAPLGPLSSADRWRTRADSGLARIAVSRRAAGTTAPSTEAMQNDLRDIQPPGAWTLAVLAAASLAIASAISGATGAMARRGARER